MKSRFGCTDIYTICDIKVTENDFEYEENLKRKITTVRLYRGVWQFPEREIAHCKTHVLIPILSMN